MTKNAGGQTPPTLAGAAWLARPETQAVLGAITAAGFDARVVGGAVRNALIGKPVTDIDIATTALPDVVIRLSREAGLQAVPTGIDHGTVTVIAGHVPHEVTTLRHDVETFGRRANVAYTSDWAADAARRDFTINALYCDARGEVLDPLGGLADLESRRVRFIGHAEDRIREDFLRILRFYRFSAEYAAGQLDTTGRAACRSLRDGLDGLSRERIRAELLRLLAAPRAVEIVFDMNEDGVLARVVGEGADPARLERLASLEAFNTMAADPIVRLGALALSAPGSALALRERLKLSNAEYERLARMALPDRALDPLAPEHSAKTFLYRFGRDAFTSAMLLDWARHGSGPIDVARSQRLALADRWTPPPLPVRGSDVLALGVPAGPAVGHILSAFEDWWISADFPDDPQLCARELQRAAKVTSS